MSSAARALEITEIDWANGHVWVADKAPLLVDAQASTVDFISASRPSGEQVRLPSQTTEILYYPVEGGAVLKPRYKPLKAWAVMAACTILLPDGNTMESGVGAILTEDDKTFHFVEAERFERDFVVVGYRGTPRPATPFST
ncbi:MAG: hypothetical protein ACSHXB_01035 [Sulfitobacter sp.]